MLTYLGVSTITWTPKAGKIEHTGLGLREIKRYLQDILGMNENNQVDFLYRMLKKRKVKLLGHMSPGLIL